MIIRCCFHAILLLTAFCGAAALADRPDLSRFKPQDKLLLRQCLDMLEARPELYAHVTLDERRQQVLRFTKEPLSRVNGKHPENPPALTDMPLVLLGLPMSPQAARLLSGCVSQHNKALRKEPERPNTPDQVPAVATPLPSTSSPLSPRLETGSTAVPASTPKFEIGEVKPLLTWYEKEFPTMAPLDKLLCLVAQEASINGARFGSPNCYKGSGEFWVKEKEAWVRNIDQFRASLASDRREGSSSAGPSNRELLAAVGKLEPATNDIIAAIADFRGTERVIAEIREKRKAGRDRDNVTHVVADAMFGLSDEQLNNMEAKGGKWAEQAEEYRRLRAEARTALMRQFANDLALTFGYGEMSMRRMQPLVARAEVRRQQVVVESLVPAVRARSGPATAHPGLEVKFCAVARGGASHARDKEGYVTIHSTAAVELRQLTVLLKIETTLGDRYATLYVPRLPPRANAYFEKITLASAALKDELAYSGTPPDLTRVRYAAWCSQFRAEGRDVKIVTPQELVSDIWLQAAQPGCVYVSNNSFYRHQLTFEKLRRLGDGYAIEFELIDYQAKGAKEHFEGKLTLPPIQIGKDGEVLDPSQSSGRPEEKAVLIQARSPTRAIGLSLTWFWNDLDHAWRGLTSFDNKLVARGACPDAAPFDCRAEEAIEAAIALAREEKFDEYQATLERVIADYPGTPWEHRAKYMLSTIDGMKRFMRNQKESQKRLEENLEREKKRKL